jgi:hypothetical protein
MMTMNNYTILICNIVYLCKQTFYLLFIPILRQPCEAVKTIVDCS